MQGIFYPGLLKLLVPPNKLIINDALIIILLTFYLQIIKSLTYLFIITILIILLSRLNVKFNELKILIHPFICRFF